MGVVKAITRTASAVKNELVFVEIISFITPKISLNFDQRKFGKKTNKKDKKRENYC